MNHQEAREHYEQARKQGIKDHKNCVLHGKYPYPQVLDEILSDPSMVAGQVDMGVLEIPVDQIVGTKTAGRRTAFSADFMPLLEVDSEFAHKWMELCVAHLGDEGIRDPIRCWEYLGRFYVQEGNKRVSVLKSYGASTIPGYVTRVIPTLTDDPEIQCYYEFLDAYRHTGLYRVRFAKSGGFQRLQASLGFSPDHVWTEEERLRFRSSFTYFYDAYRKQGGDELTITAADALVVWLQVYPFSDLKNKMAPELQKSLAAIWTDLRAMDQGDPINVSVEAVDSDPGILRSLVNTVFPPKLKIAFFNELNPETSNWIRSHDVGRQYMEAILGDRVEVTVYNDLIPGDSAEQAMEDAIQNGAEVLFSTTPPLVGVCRKIAVLHPNVKILNCSVGMPFTGVRTYYSRIYEGKFVLGAIAGAMCRSNEIGCVASYPIFGVPAGINAFALGAKLTNPDARVRLRWSCCDSNALQKFAEEGVTFVANRDIPTPADTSDSWGLCRLNSSGTYDSLASPYWHWGKFYEKMVRAILNGGWDALSSKSKDGEKAVNYWWGMRSGVVDMLLGPELPEGVRKLAELLQRSIVEGQVFPFHRTIRSQDGVLRNDGNHWLTTEELLTMDWLCDAVDGEIPNFEELLPVSRSIVRILGVYRTQIIPEREEPML